MKKWRREGEERGKRLCQQTASALKLIALLMSVKQMCSSGEVAFCDCAAPVMGDGWGKAMKRGGPGSG